MADIANSVAEGTFDPALPANDLPVEITKLQQAGFKRAHELAKPNYDYPDNLRGEAEGWGADATAKGIAWNGDANKTPPIELKQPSDPASGRK